jgi:vancomycin resistance protein YoaR
MPQMENESQPSRVSRVISLGRAQIVGLACLPLVIFALAFARFSSSDRVLAGVSVAGARVAGYEAARARSELEAQARVLAKRELVLTLGAKRSALSIEDLGVQLLPRESAARALAAGRSSGLFANAFSYLASFWREQQLAGDVRVDAARFDAALDKLASALIDDPPFAGGVEVRDGQASSRPPRAGRKIKRQALRDALSRAVALGSSAAVPVEVEVVTPVLAPGSLDRAMALAVRALSRPVALVAGERRLEISPAELGTLLQSQVRGSELHVDLDPTRVEAWLAPRREKLESPARDARFEVSPTDEIRIVPGESGVRLAAEAVAAALWSAAQNDAHQGELPLLREPLPARTVEQAEKLGIRKLVGTFTTRHPCCQPRVANIHRIATLMDGLVVEPGQTVSVNQVVGPRTQKNGFVLAPGIEDGEMVDTVGGGVSQFATTFFNAIFHAGYDIIERQPHTYWFPRYPMGHEATLSWPHPDIVFKNDSDAGLLVKTSFSKTTITVKLYGDTGGRRVTAKVSERRDIVQPTVELLPNREVEADEEKVKDGGMIGWSVIASRTVTFADGTKKEEKRKVTYKPKARRVEVHPCRIPKGEPGATGEPCPEPEDVEEPSEEAPAQAE